MFLRIPVLSMKSSVEKRNISCRKQPYIVLEVARDVNHVAAIVTLVSDFTLSLSFVWPFSRVTTR